ncbi:hypothetical protein CBS147323_3171 [Aspergillus niger]|nr:hypothetical protein CBS147323_3171 [Aspergillus niger]KAI3030436.1 hypothetical protein CBS147345_1757 [Aspergillus niger]KAI3032198.1 hypothetical protein CBS147347_1368 [Aspergillus niger]
MYEMVTYVVHLICLRQPAAIGTARQILLGCSVLESDISSFSFSCLSYLFLARSPFFFSPPFSPFRSGRHDQTRSAQ